MAYGIYAPRRTGDTFYLVCPIQSDEPNAWMLAEKHPGTRVVWGTRETLPAKLTLEEINARTLRVRSYEAGGGQPQGAT